jgi:S1-C subfamily serine protease
VIRDARATGGKMRVILSDSTSYDARFVGASRSNDLAVLQISAPASKLKPVVVGSSGDLKVGQKVYAIGSPFSLDQSLTTGIVSGLGREIETESNVTIRDVIQVNAAINPGNSGGPLLDSAGRLIGVNTAIVSPTGAFSGIGFAIPVDTVNAVVTELIRSGSDEPPSLGITPQPEEASNRLREWGIIREQGVIVADVWEGGAAAAAGIRPTRRLAEGRMVLGDIIVAFDGEPVRDVKTLARLVASKKVDQQVTVTVVRGDERLNIPVTLRPRPEEPER